MKPIALLLLAFTAATAHAGSFGGPPPFTNGSPLQSGVNGAYQASARGSNLSGVIGFTYSSGVQSTAAPNSWIIFYQGEVYSGTPDVAIMDGNISGVLETTFTTPVTRTSSTTTPAESTTLAPLANPSGYFTAKLDNNSPTGSFKGKGALAAVFTKTVIIGANTTITTETISAPFKVKGVRANTGT